jgi:CTP synthase
LIEVGGTVGAIESQPFLEAIREMRHELGDDNTAFVHITWLPYLKATDETKTKPTQHSVRELRSIGILADMIIARSDYPVEKELTQKIAKFCDVKPEAVIPLVTADMLYEIPLQLENMKVADILMKELGLEARHEAELDGWRWMVDELRKEKPTVKVALVGKYVELHDAYLSVREALKHAALYYGVDVEIDWISSTELEKVEDVSAVLGNADAVLVPGGFGSRGVEGKILAAKHARENRIPYLGICLGMQVMVIDYARHVLGLEDANSTEFDKMTEHPVIALMDEQKGLDRLGGTMRLGLYPCTIKKDSKTYHLYQQDTIEERHRHRYEFNNEERQLFEDSGIIFSGQSPDGLLVEIVENPDHPYMIASQFHPEFLSRPNRPNPLFLGLIQAACRKKGLPDEIIALGFKA